MRFRFLLLTLLLPLGPLPAQESTFPRPFLHESLLERSPIIVRAAFVKDEMLPPSNVQLTTFEVQSVLKGPPQERVIVAGMGDRGRVFHDLDKLLFLERLNSGFLYRLIDLIDLTPEDGSIREEFIRAYLALDLDGSPLELRDQVKELAMRGIESRSPWAMGLGVRELERLVRAAPHLFAARDLARLQRRRRSMPLPERARFSKILAALSSHVAASFAGAEEVFEAGPERDLFMRSVERFRSFTESEERLRLLDAMVETFGFRLGAFCRMLIANEDRRIAERAVWYVGEFGDVESAPAVIQRLKGASPGEGLIYVEALGKLGIVDAVRALRERVGSAAEADAVLTALGRIGGAEAAAVLDGLEAQLAREPGEEERLARVRYLRTLDFAKKEARRRRDARERYRR